MEILSYLIELIKTRKEVGIYDLGTICKKKSPGRYDPETHSFFPPSYVLEFTSALIENEALKSYISEKRNVSSDTVEYYIDQFVQEVFAKLEDQHQAELGELGTLFSGVGGINFVPRKDLNIGFDFYGLPNVKDEFENLAKEEEKESASLDTSIDILEQDTEEIEERLNLENNNADLRDTPAYHEISEYKDQDLPEDEQIYEEISEVKEVEKVEKSIFIETPEGLEEEHESSNRGEIEKAPVEVPSSSTWNFDQNIPLVAPVFYNTDSEVKKENGMPGYLKVIIGLLILIVIAGIVYFIKPELFSQSNKVSPEIKKENKISPSKAVITTQADSLSQSDSLINANEKAILAVDSAKGNPIASSNQSLPLDTVTTWEVIGASVINDKEANHFIQQMKAIGITAKVIPTAPGKRRIKISVGSFNDELSAREGRKKLVVKLKNEGLYKHQNKHTHKP